MGEFDHLCGYFRLIIWKKKEKLKTWQSMNI